MVKQVDAALGRVVFGHLEPDEDLLAAIKTIARTHEMRAGVVMSITGALRCARLQHFERPGQNDGPIGVVELTDDMEVSGHGIVGVVEAPGRRESFGVGGYVDGDVYVHVHLAVTTSSQTLVGHLMPGCLVRSRNPISHFTIVMAEIEGAKLAKRVDEGLESGSKGHGGYHVVESL
jgi:predicted DNA-binding protein with PD1-like motif